MAPSSLFPDSRTICGEDQVTKVEAALRQLEAAILLYFNGQDPLAIHTLASAAHEILCDLNVKRGGRRNMIKNADFVAPDRQKELNDHLRHPQNFLKHANKDPEATLTHHTMLTDGFLYESCQKYEELTGDHRPLLGLYLRWVMIWNRECYSLTPETRQWVNRCVKLYGEGERSRFFQDMLPVAYAGISRTQGRPTTLDIGVKPKDDI